jgi:ABC-type transporter MlaC component
MTKLEDLKFDPKYNLQMIFELCVEIIALQQATNKVMTEKLYGDLAPEVQHEIFKTTAEMKPQVMESLYAIFGKTPAVVSKKPKK